MENDPLIGKQVGAYLIQGKLGEGGMAQVYKAWHARLRRDVAIKVILPQVADKAGFRERFEREAQLIARLEHQNIVAVYDFGEEGNLTYLVMQYVGGGTLRNQLRGGQPIEPRRAAQYALQMARALHQAHLRGIVHRDVKPQNMLVSSNDSNQLLLSDFGIAKLFLDSRQESMMSTIAPGSESNVGSDPSLTRADQMIGTAEYMAPEQINRQPVDARTDVYALGVVLFQMLTGQVPFRSTTINGLLFQHVYTAPPPVRELNPNVPEALAQITARALAKAPEDRFQSAEAMAQALEAVLTASPYQLSAPLGGNYASPAGPGSGSAVYPSQERPIPSAPSYPGQPSAPGTAPYGQSLASGVSSTGGSAIRIPTADGGSLVVPTRPRSTARIRVSSIAAALVIGLAVVLTLIAQGRINLGSGSGSNSTTTTMATPFTENFQNNNRNWSGNFGGMTAIVSNQKYTISVSDGNTYFPHPAPDGTTSGPLPGSFTLTVQIQRNTGDLSGFYGLAFRLRQNGSNVYSYTLLINGNSNYIVAKYDGDAHSHLRSGQLSAIQGGLNMSNTLQAIVQGNKFSFKINGTVVPVNGPSATDQSITDSDLMGGQLGMVVTGPNSSFTVTEVQLAIP